MSSFQLALVGGFFSFASTGVGALLAPAMGSRKSSVASTHKALDFAIGVMLSSVAFSLLGPGLIQASHSAMLFSKVLLGGVLGAGFVLVLKKAFEASSLSFASREKQSPSKILLAAVLVLHGFPEGMGAGASMAGMSMSAALPLQLGLAAQNIVEGAILALCFVGFGWTWRKSIFGSVLSGLVEWLGAAVAGVGLMNSTALLSPLLAAAGGAMLVSVVLEIYEQTENRKQVSVKPFFAGLALIPLMNTLFA